MKKFAFVGFLLVQLIIGSKTENASESETLKELQVPKYAPTTIIVFAFNSTCLNATWHAIPEIDNLIGYRLKYWEQGSKENDATYDFRHSKQNWALIVDLKPDTYYFVKVIACFEAGEGPESERYLERTYKKAPQKAPIWIRVYAVNSSTLHVEWNELGVTKEEEPVKGYKVHVWESDENMTTIDHQDMAYDKIISVENKLECIVDKLTRGKEYNMRLLAFSNGGDGRMSSPSIILF